MKEFRLIRSCGVFNSQSAPQRKFHNAIRTPVRTVEHYEIEMFFEGGGEMQLNGKQYPRTSGCLLVARPGDQRCSTLPFECHFVSLSNVPAELAELLDRLTGVIYPEKTEPFRTAFQRICSGFLSEDPYSRLAVMGEVLLLLHMLHQQQTVNHLGKGTNEAEEVLEKAQCYIEQHYHEEISVEQIARACHVSISYLHRLFANRLGMTPHAAVIRRRISAARLLLISEQYPVAEIAWRCGFRSPSYFSDCFRKCVGVSPRAYRDHTAYPV